MVPEVVASPATGYSTARVLSGNLRLLLGMVRANRPWRLAVGLTSSLGTVGGALGAGLENDEAVREAACTYRPQRTGEKPAERAATTGGADNR